MVGEIDDVTVIVGDKEVDADPHCVTELVPQSDTVGESDDVVEIVDDVEIVPDTDCEPVLESDDEALREVVAVPLGLIETEGDGVILPDELADPL